LATVVAHAESVALFHQLVALRAQRAATGTRGRAARITSPACRADARTLERMNPFLKEFDGGIFRRCTCSSNLSRRSTSACKRVTR